MCARCDMVWVFFCLQIDGRTEIQLSGGIADAVAAAAATEVAFTPYIQSVE